MGLYSPFISRKTMQIKYIYNIICSYYSLLVKNEQKHFKYLEYMGFAYIYLFVFLYIFIFY